MKQSQINTWTKIYRRKHFATIWPRQSQSYHVKNYTLHRLVSHLLSHDVVASCSIPTAGCWFKSSLDLRLSTITWATTWWWRWQWHVERCQCWVDVGSRWYLWGWMTWGLQDTDGFDGHLILIAQLWAIARIGRCVSLGRACDNRFDTAEQWSCRRPDTRTWFDLDLNFVILGC